MSDNSERALREETLAAQWLSWIAMRHFLPAVLLRELASILVKRVSLGTLSIEDLFEDSMHGTRSGLGNWYILPKPADASLATYLQRRVRFLALQIDSDTHVPEGERVDAESTLLAKWLEAAILLGNADFLSNPDLQRSIPEASDPVIHVIANLIDQTPALLKDDDGARLETQLNERLRTVPTPLSIVIFKHIGDLCADFDRWDAALRLYSSLEKQLRKVRANGFGALMRPLRDATVQSKANATRIIKGASEALAILSAATVTSRLKSRPVLFHNAIGDLMSAKREVSGVFGIFHDQRGALLRPPYYHESHDLDSALRYTLEKQFSSANSYHWATLRRQLALGLFEESRETKFLYGTSLVMELDSLPLGKRHIEQFLLAMRLFVESGYGSEIRKTVWPYELVAEYVNDKTVSEVLERVGRYDGSRTRRSQVALELFRSWTLLIGVTQSSAVAQMLRYVAMHAESSEAAFDGSRDIAIRSLSILKEVGERRPEFRRSVAPEVASAVRGRIAPSGMWQAKREALEVAAMFFDVMAENDQIATITDSLALLDSIDPASRQWPVVRAAMGLLVCPSAADFAKRHAVLGERMLAEIVKFGREQDGESASFLFNLRAFDASLLQKPEIQASLRPVMDKIRANVAQYRSTATVGSIQALLLVPTISGKDAVADAFASLSKVMNLAKDHRHPHLSLPYAYGVVAMLADKKQSFVDLGISRSVVDGWYESVYADVNMVWREAIKYPLTLGAFSLPPPTQPDRTIVHNWAFASLRFARSLSRRLDMLQVLEEAQQIPSLRDHVMSGVGAESIGSDSGVDFSPDRIRIESKDVFYSLLGSRLADLLKKDAENAREICAILLNQCFRHGPNGADAGVLVMALNLSPLDGIDREAQSAYLQRLEGERELRLSLIPLALAVSKDQRGNVG